jgi:hypothetical protein
VVSALLAGCGSGATEAGPVPTSSAAVAPTDTKPAESAGTEGETSSGGGATSTEATPEPAPAPVVCDPETGGEKDVFTNLTDVRVGAHDGYDRIVFEFVAPKPNPGGNGGVPYFEIRQAKPPFTAIRAASRSTSSAMRRSHRHAGRDGLRLRRQSHLRRLPDADPLGSARSRRSSRAATSRRP